MSSELEKIIIAFPHKFKVDKSIREYNDTMKSLSKNPNISLKFIENHPEIEWEYKHISKNPNLTIEFVKKNLDKNWNWTKISSNRNITLKNIEDNPDLYWDYFSGISSNPNLTMEFIDKHIDKKWNWTSILSDKNKNIYISTEFIEKHFEKIKRSLGLFDYNYLSSHPSFSFDLVVKNPKLNWNWEMISEHKNVTMEIVQKHMKKYNMDDDDDDSEDDDDDSEDDDDDSEDDDDDSEDEQSDEEFRAFPFYKWCWYDMSKNPNLTMEFAQKYYKLSWKWGLVAENPNIKPIEIVRFFETQDYYKFYGFIWSFLSSNPNLTLEFVEKYKDKDWDWEFISQNSNIPIKSIDKYMDKEWTDFNFDVMHNHKNLTMEFIEKYIDEEWDWGEIFIHPNVSIAFLEKYSYKFPQYDYEKYKEFGNFESIRSYYERHDLNIKFMIETLNIDYLWEQFSGSHNLTAEIIMNYPDKDWHWKGMTSNRFGYDKPKVYYSQRKQQTIENTQVYKEELIAMAWEPSRFKNWCLDDEEREAMVNRWNE